MNLTIEVIEEPTFVLSGTSGVCRYVEINDGATISLKAQEIIKSNQLCIERKQVQHAGYSKIIISSR